MSEDEMISRICEVELYLTKKIIDNRGTGYKPTEGDEDQGLRDELKRLRNGLNGALKKG
jgi:hypothetical protein